MENKKKQYEISNFQANMVVVGGIVCIIGIALGSIPVGVICGLIGAVGIPLAVMKIRKEK